MGEVAREREVRRGRSGSEGREVRREWGRRGEGREEEGR